MKAQTLTACLASGLGELKHLGAGTAGAPWPLQVCVLAMWSSQLGDFSHSGSELHVHMSRECQEEIIQPFMIWHRKSRRTFPLPSAGHGGYKDLTILKRRGSGPYLFIFGGGGQDSRRVCCLGVLAMVIWEDAICHYFFLPELITIAITILITIDSY